jgi:hypothetical protein
MFPGAVSHLNLGQLRRAIPYIFIFLTTRITAKMDSIIVRRQPIEKLLALNFARANLLVENTSQPVWELPARSF